MKGKREQIRRQKDAAGRMERAVAESLEPRKLLTITVNTLVDETSGSGGTISLREAITDSPSGGTINFSVTGTIDLLLGPVEINKNLTIDGPGASELTIDGGGHSTVINNAYGRTLTLSGLTITGGDDTVDFGGGGVRNLGNLTVSDSVISGNTALFGGGIYSGYQYAGLGYSSLTVVNSTISGNQAVTSANDPLAGKGGGIFTGYSTANVTNSTLSGNTSYGNVYDGAGGAAIYGNPTITDSTISGNHAQGGGGAIQGHQATIIQSTICNNLFAGIDEDGSGTTIAQSTIVGNYYGIQGSMATLSNSIVAGNGGADIDGTLDPSVCHNNLIGTAYIPPSQEHPDPPPAFGGLTNGVNGNMVDVADPGIELTYTNQPILANHGGLTQTVLVYDYSPAVNHGDNALIPDDPSTGQPLTTDQNGASRVFDDGTVDIGATEIQGLVVPSTVVNTTADEVTPNSTTSLREAIGFAEQSTSPATITFDPTIFSTPQSIQLVLGELRVFSTSVAITIDGPGASLVEIDGQDLSPDFATLGAVTISGLTIANGNGSQSLLGGGGIGEVSGTLTVSNSVITDNSTSGNAGGINVQSGSLTITNSTISSNQGTGGEGGGIDCGLGGSVSISDSTISGNTSKFGGGIFINGGLTITNSTISGNTATGGGGAIFLSGGGGTITDSTISNNKYVGIVANPGLTLTNTIVAGNTPVDFEAGVSLTNSDNNLIGSAAPFAGGLVNGANGNIVGVTNVYLGPLANNGGTTQTMALLPNSPAINAGVAVSGVTTDQRGIARPQGAAPDIGAYERQATNAQLTSMSYEYIAREAVTFNFSSDASVTFSQSSYTLLNVTTNQLVPAGLGSFSFNSAGTQATLVLTNLLPNARYSVTSGTTTLDFFVLVGDANHDGVVDSSDYSRIDNAYLADQIYLASNPGGTALPYTGFNNGDFNYDGVINGSDYTLIDNAFNTQGASLAAEVAADGTALAHSFADPPAAGTRSDGKGMAFVPTSAFQTETQISLSVTVESDIEMLLNKKDMIDGLAF